MAIVAGLDIGAGTAKALILTDHRIVSYTVMPSGYNTINTAEKIINDVCSKASISYNEIKRIVTTGYSRSIIPFARRPYRNNVPMHAERTFKSDQGQLLISLPDTK
jgi:activator of 2-hydroxyglutaryl-CoA dehydratase